MVWEIVFFGGVSRFWMFFAGAWGFWMFFFFFCWGVWSLGFRGQTPRVRFLEGLSGVLEVFGVLWCVVFLVFWGCLGVWVALEVAFFFLEGCLRLGVFAGAGKVLGVLFFGGTFWWLGGFWGLGCGFLGGFWRFGVRGANREGPSTLMVGLRSISSTL